MLIDFLMAECGLGFSYNKRNVHAGIVTVNGQVVANTHHALHPGDIVKVGRHQTFTVSP
jgi:hypothetical protein